MASDANESAQADTNDSGKSDGNSGEAAERSGAAGGGGGKAPSGAGGKQRAAKAAPRGGRRTSAGKAQAGGDDAGNDEAVDAAPQRGQRKRASKAARDSDAPALRADTSRGGDPVEAASTAGETSSAETSSAEPPPAETSAAPRRRKAAAPPRSGASGPARARTERPAAAASAKRGAAAAAATSPAKQAAGRGRRRRPGGEDREEAPSATKAERTARLPAARPDDGGRATEPAAAGAPRKRAVIEGKGKGDLAAGDRKGWNPFGAYARAGEKLLVRMRPEKLTAPEKIVQEIRRGPQGPKVVAAFDFDGTLVGGYTGGLVLQERMKRKEVKFAEIAETAGITFKAMTRLLEANELVSHSMAQWAGKTEEEMEELGGHLFQNKIQDMVFPEMREIIAAHREAGHTIVVATSASRFQVEPTVKLLGIDHLLCTQVEVAEGKLTGKLVGDSLFGPGKVAAIKNFIAEHGGTLADTYFYADGDEEVGLMEAVGHPHPINPSRKLTEASRANGWPVLRLQSRGSPKPGNFVRAVAGLMSVMPILQAGLAVGLLTRDKRQAANLIMPTWIQAQLDLAGVKLRVSGRKNLWARRPAVFIFNHRNNYDGSFVAALVRTDYVSLAKKEMANNPIGKLVTAIMPTVLIDREAGGDPRALLQPVIDATNKGYSIMLAPEGTRVPGNFNSVGPFKKGAFHMAMAAGIPIVPVVIRNALDVAARDAGAMRPGTVDVAVLPPISVEDWTPENMNDKIEEVRQLFIGTLNDWPEPDDDEEE